MIPWVLLGTTYIVRDGRRPVFRWYYQTRNKSCALKRRYFICSVRKVNHLLISCYRCHWELGLDGLRGNWNLLAPVFVLFYTCHAVSWCPMWGARSKFQLHAIELFALLTEKRGEVCSNLECTYFPNAFLVILHPLLYSCSFILHANKYVAYRYFYWKRNPFSNFLD